MDDREYEEFCVLANWLQYKGVEEGGRYWEMHVKAQEALEVYERRHQTKRSHYYDEYFFPYIVCKNKRFGADKDWDSKEWERNFPRDYEAMIAKYMQELS